MSGRAGTRYLPCQNRAEPVVCGIRSVTIKQRATETCKPAARKMAMAQTIFRWPRPCCGSGVRDFSHLGIRNEEDHGGLALHRIYSIGNQPSLLKSNLRFPQQTTVKNHSNCRKVAISLIDPVRVRLRTDQALRDFCSTQRGHVGTISQPRARWARWARVIGQNISGRD